MNSEARDHVDEEPDYQLSLAAEHTYLAYVRTGLALLLQTPKIIGYLGFALVAIGFASSVVVLTL